MPRIPSPEVVRFLLKNWPNSTAPLSDVKEEIERNSSILDGYGNTDHDHAGIKDSLNAMFADKPPTTSVRECAKPTVICIFGQSGDGKTTLMNFLKEEFGILSFATDDLFWRLAKDLSVSERIRKLAKEKSDGQIHRFIETVQEDNELAVEYIREMFDPLKGFNSTAPVSVIEGYLRYGTQKPSFDLEALVIQELKNRGYRPWLMFSPQALADRTDNS